MRRCIFSIALLLWVFDAHDVKAVGNYDDMLDEIEQWQRDNPDVCGLDTPTCGVQRLIDRSESCDAFRIVNGCDVSKPDILGWQVAVRITGLDTTFCGGTLVSSRHVVLARSCFRSFSSFSSKDGKIPQKDTLKSLAVIVGALDISQPSTIPEQQVYQAMKYAVHPDLDGAIVKLNRVISFSTGQNGVRPACLPSEHMPRLVRQCIVSGYGLETIQRPYSGYGTLRYTVMQMVGDKTCDFYHQGLRQYEFCATSIRRLRPSDVCIGDAGSGLICKDERSGRWTLQGITPDTGDCAQTPSLFEDVHALNLVRPSSQAATASKPTLCKSSSTIPDGSVAIFWDKMVAADIAAQNEKTKKPPPLTDVEQIPFVPMVSEINLWHSSNPGACGTDTTCGVQKMADQFEQCDSGYRVVNGCEVNKPEVFGWAVLVQAGRLICSGTLVSPRHIALAAHCFNAMPVKPPPIPSGPLKVPADFFKITINVARKVEATSQDSKVEAIAFAPGYLSFKSDTDKVVYDFALIRLASEVKSSENGARPVCMPSQPMSRTATQCISAGHGLNNSYERTGADVLRYAVLQGISDTACLHYAGINYKKDEQFCALGERHGGIANTCSGDYGGGVVCKDKHTSRWTLQGVKGLATTSCGKQPNVYVDVYAVKFQAQSSPPSSPSAAAAPPAEDKCKPSTPVMPLSLSAAVDDVLDRAKTNKPLTNSNRITDALTVVRRSYDDMLGEIKLWQSSNPDVCGLDTTTCGVQRMVDRAEACDTYRITNRCYVDQQSTIGWSVSILINGQLCGGTLLSPRHVATSAWCLTPLQSKQVILPESVAVLIGVVDMREAAFAQSYDVAALATHSQFKAIGSYDAAILKLDRDVSFSVNGLRLACLPSTRSSRSFLQCIVSGYGINVDPKNIGMLRYGVMQGISDSACSYFYGAQASAPERTLLFNEKTPVSFCAFGTMNGRNGVDTCTGDFGSGLLCKDSKSGRWSLQGIASFANKNSCGDIPALFADAYEVGFQSPTKRQSSSTSSADRCKPTSDIMLYDNGDAPANVTKAIDDFVAAQRRDEKPIAGDANSSPSPRPVPVLESPSKSSPAAELPNNSAKNVGGIAKTATKTIHDYGCTKSDECETNTCKPVELCIAKETVAKRRKLNVYSPAQRFRLLSITRSSFRLGEANKEDESVLKSLTFTVRGSDRRCARTDICWPATWLKFYANKVPTFNLL